MANTGDIMCGTGENNAGIGTSAWTNPGNITADDTNYAIAQPSASQYLVARNFDFSSIPDGSTINGVLVKINASEHAGGTEALLAQLQDASGTLFGSSKSNTNEGNISGTAKATYTFGSTSDLWGATLSTSIVKDVDFGVRFWFTTAHNVEVDFVQMQIEYTTATGTTYTVTKDDTLATGDEQSRMLLRQRRLDDTLDLLDSSPRSLLLARLIGDTLAVLDASGGAKVIVKVLQDTLAVYDYGVERIWEVIDEERDALLLVDPFLYQLITSGAIYAKISSDTLELIDQHMRVLFRMRLRDDVIEVSDALSASAERRRSASEVLEIIDIIARSALRGRVSSDAVEVSDSLLFASIRSRLLSDSVGVTDSVQQFRLLYRALSDAVDVVDNIIASVIGGAVIYRISDDGLAVGDEFTRRLLLNRRLDDGAGVLDSIIRQAGLTRDSSDTLVVSDQVMVTRTLNRLTSDDLGLADEALRFLLRMRTLSEQFDLDENILHARINMRAVSDLLNVTDALEVLLSGPGALIDVCVMLGVRADMIAEVGIDVVALLDLEATGVVLSAERLLRLALDQPNIALGAYN